MKNFRCVIGSQKGVTLLELIVVAAMVAIGVAIAVPLSIPLVHKSQFRGGALEVMTTVMTARSNSVRDNDSWRVVFNYGANSFDLVDFNGTTINTHNLSEYGYGIHLVNEATCGHADKNWNNTVISPAAFISFTGRGTASNGSVFLEDASDDVCYAVSASNNGVIRLHRYKGAKPYDLNSWEN